MSDRPEAPRALGGGAPQSREQLARVPLRSLPRPSRLLRPVSEFAGVGPAAAKRLAKLGIETAQDLLEHLPFDHRDYEGQRAVAELAIGEEATVLVRVRDCRVRPTRRRRLQIVEARVADETGPLKAVWFNQAYLVDQLKEGTTVLLRGRLESGRGDPTFRVSEHEIARAGDDALGRHTTGLVPIYPATEGLSARRIRELAHGLHGEERDTVEPLPARIRARERLPARADALHAAHWPASALEVSPARRRLAFEELLLFQLALVGRRRTRQEARRAEQLTAPGELVARWIESLPFELTSGQREALGEVDEDLVDRAADAASPDGRGRLRQDRRRALLDAPCCGGGHAGRAHGADRDARRAALRDGREPRAGRSVRRRGGDPARPTDRPARPARRLRASGATCSSASPPASCACWSARTR